MKRSKLITCGALKRAILKLHLAIFGPGASFELEYTEVRQRPGLVHRFGHHYKYKSLASNEKMEQVVEILRDSKVYFSRPRELNDPDEARPQLVIGDIGDPHYRPIVDAWVRRCVTQHPFQPTEAEIQAELARLTQSKLNEMAVAATREFHAAVEDRYRIFSMATSPFNRHLWENYADGFNGACIEFDINSAFGATYAVNYSDAPRTIDLARVTPFEDMIQTTLVKGTRWQDENEARMISGDPPIDADQPTLINQRHSFPHDCLTGLIIGHKVDRTRRQQLLALARARLRSVRCYIARPLPWGEGVHLSRIP